MGWDLTVLNITGDRKRLAVVSDDAVLPLGSAEDVIATIQRAFPDADATDTTWIVVRGEGYSLEISIEQKEPVEFITIHVHGEENGADAVSQLAKVSGWSFLDAALGDFIDFGTGEHIEGFRRAQTYKQQVSRKQNL